MNDVTLKGSYYDVIVVQFTAFGKRVIRNQKITPASYGIRDMVRFFCLFETENKIDKYLIK